MPHDNRLFIQTTAHPGTDQATLDAERDRRNVDVMMLAAYHQAKALAELMTTLRRLSRFLPQTEQAVMRNASIDAVNSYAALDSIVADMGNRLGAVRNNMDTAQRVAYMADLM